MSCRAVCDSQSKRRVNSIFKFSLLICFLIYVLPLFIFDVSSSHGKIFPRKLAKGEIASLAGAADDPRYFQISLPVQPGNSGGALVDARGNVVGIVAAKLDASAALAATGSLPENVNYAVKSSLLLSFLESVPDVAAKLKEPNTKDESFEEVVKSAQEAAVLVLVY